jgi:hypothetical protein
MTTSVRGQGRGEAVKREEGWWLIRRARQTKIKRALERPKTPKHLKDYEWQVVGPFATEAEVEAFRESVTDRNFDADDRGEVEDQ